MSTAEDRPDEDRPSGYRRVDDVDFGELIAGLGGSIAEAQLSLERGFVQSTRELADERVEVVSRVVPRVVTTDDGRREVVYESETEERSLLELGITPPRYQFSETTVDVEFDLSFAHEEEDTERTGRTRLRADTHEVTHRRRYQEAATATARVSARLVPVPLPVTLDDPPTVEPTVEDETEVEGHEENAKVDEETEASVDEETEGPVDEEAVEGEHGGERGESTGDGGTVHDESEPDAAEVETEADGAVDDGP
jgi:hypothetical protein